MGKFSQLIHSMRTKHLILFILYLCNVLLTYCQPSNALINGHAHNDYVHNRPLMLALENGFISVEADVHLKDGKLLVSHDDPLDLSKTKTLEQLYLEPLRELVRKNNGKVYKDYGGFFYLMIDFKTEANATYKVLNEVLSRYHQIISIVTDSLDQNNKPIKVFISGNRPIEMYLKSKSKFTGLDGRPDQIGLNFPVSFMPIVSDNISNFMLKDLNTSSQSIDKVKLTDFVNNVHLEGKKVRFWGAPDDPKTWQFLLNNGVDLINTDKIKSFAKFIEENKI